MRGHTLAEVIIAAALFATFLTLATGLFVNATRSTGAGEARGVALDEGRGLLYRLTAEVRPASAVLDAGPGHVVLQSGTDTIAYTLDSQSRIQRFLYQPGTQQPIPNTRRLMTTGPSSLACSLAANTLTVVLSITPAGAPAVTLRTRITPRRALFAP